MVAFILWPGCSTASLFRLETGFIGATACLDRWPKPKGKWKPAEQQGQLAGVRPYTMN